VEEIRHGLAPETPVEVWFQDEMRVGQKNKLTYRWARKGSRPRAAHDQRTQSQFLKGLALVHDVVQLDFTDRVGLRYLDHVAPRPNDSLDQYVVPEVRGLGARLGGKAVHSYSETFSHVGDVQLRSRVVIQDGGLAFPPDLTLDGMKIDDRFLGYSGHHATLDTDGFIEGRMVFSAPAVGEQLHAIHGVISAAFKAAVTEHAFKVWDEV
jgi:uncharacterized protein (TIGR04255 family)